jgi:hypothetical protein
MISNDDIDAFAEENGDALKAAAKFAERQERGLPPDRWASAQFQHAVAQGIRAQWVIIAMLTAAVEAQAEELAAIQRRAVE